MCKISAKYCLLISLVIVIAYVLCVITMTILGIKLWLLHCEGEGCLGNGIGWIAWSFCFLLMFLLGYLAQRLYRGAGHYILRYILAAQTVVGFALIVYWVNWRLTYA